METQDIEISQIKEYESNAKQHPDYQVDKIATSIEKFGFKQPLVVDKNGVIIIGHGRYKAAKKLNLKTVPCIVATDLTEAQAKAFRLADNRVAESEIDINVEFNEIVALKDLDFDFSGLGLDSFSLDDIEDFDGYDVEDDERDSFSKTFTFPIEKKKAIISYLKKHQNEIVEKIIQEAEKE